VTAANEFTFVAPPAVTEVGPAEGPTAGGNTVTIGGSGFTGASKVEFGTAVVNCPHVGTPGHCEVKSDTEIEVEAPAQSAKTIDVKVTTPVGGTSATGPADEYTFVAPPAITGLSPARGSTSGGNVVIIEGLRLGAASKVVFGETESAILEDTGTTVTTTAPAHAAGAVHVRVTTVGGTSEKFAADEYTYEVPAPAPPAPAPPTTGAGAGPGAVAGGSAGGAQAGTARLPGGTVQVQGDKALVRLGCTGAGPCQGTLKLSAKVVVGQGRNHKKKTVVIGKASYDVGAGKTATVKVKITNGQVRRLLKEGKTVKAGYAGPGLKAGTVKLRKTARQKGSSRRITGDVR
jgi:hypothetical protein